MRFSLLRNDKIIEFSLFQSETSHLIKFICFSFNNFCTSIILLANKKYIYHKIAEDKDFRKDVT